MKKTLLAMAFCFALSVPAWGQEQVASEVPNNTDELKITLKRLVVGNQGAILKIWKKEGGAEPDYYRGLDDRDTAPYSSKDQQALVESMGMSATEIENTAQTVMTEYGRLPKKNALAFLGLVHSLEDDSPFEPNDQIEGDIKSFLLTRLKEDKSVIMRRQACLSLAVGDTLDQEILEAVISFYSNSENLWETFPVQQFFEYHAPEISKMPNYTQVRAQVEAVDSLYKANILGYLDEAQANVVSSK